MYRTMLTAVLIAAAFTRTAMDADAARGATLAEDCAACRGPAGVSVSGDIPNLAARKHDYITSQLKAFRDGKRTNKLVNPIAAGFSDGNIADLAAHFASLAGAEPCIERTATPAKAAGKWPS